MVIALYSWINLQVDSLPSREYLNIEMYELTMITTIFCKMAPAKAYVAYAPFIAFLLFITLAVPSYSVLSIDGWPIPPYTKIVEYI